ncbi:hypothetical protein Tco_0213703 [Tanacetum coccineum]
MTRRRHPRSVGKSLLLVDYMEGNILSQGKEEPLHANPTETLDTIRQHAKGQESSGSASRQAQKTELVVGQDGSGGSGVGVVIGLSVAAGAGGPGGVGVGTQGSSHTRWTKRRVQTERISPQKRTPTQPTSQPSTSSQVPVSEIRNADGRKMGDAIPKQSSAVGGTSERSFL